MVVLQNKAVIRVFLCNPPDMVFAIRLLEQAGMDFLPCSDIDMLFAQDIPDTGALLVDEECLTPQQLDKLQQCLKGQPSWSDLPVILLIKRGAITGSRTAWPQWMGNLIVVERPVASAALISVIQMALRARMRQYEVRDLIASLEQRVAERTLHLERTVKELEQFTSVASHDLQEPLRMVKGFVDLLAQRYGDSLDDQAKEYISFAVDGATRMSNLISDLLKYSRAGGRDIVLASSNVEAILGTVLINMTVALESSGAVITHDPLPTVRADTSQITQVLQNLIGNAVKFRSPNRQCQVHISAKTDGNNWVFFVRDNGIGIDPQYKDRIFVIFERLHGREEHEGTGIGLAICKKIVERHGGRIWIESEPGVGSTFYFTIPNDPK